MAIDNETLGAAIAICGTGGGGGSPVGAYTFKGSVATVNDLPALGNEVGDIYDVRNTDMNYAWTGTAWDALGQIVDVQALEDEIDGKVDKITGKGLSTNDYTTAEKEKLAGIEAGAEVNTITGIKGDSESSYRTGNVNITKANIELGNVDNTADVDKPVSTAQQAALDLKQNILTFDNTPTANSNNPVKSSGIKAALDEKNNIEPHNYAYDGADLSTIFADADALYAAYHAEDYSHIHVGDYWPVTLNGTYRDYGQMTAPVGISYYSDTALTQEIGTLYTSYIAEGVQNTNIPGCHEAYCTIKIGGNTYYVAWDDCLDYLERTLSNAIMKFEIADINPYWRYGDSGDLTDTLPHLCLQSRDGLPHTLKMRKLNEVWENQHIDTFTGDGVQSEFTLSGTVGTIGYVFVNGTKKTYNTHYTYANDKVTFKSGSIPANGDVVKIEWCDGYTPWNGSALYRTFNDPDFGIINLIQTADAKLYSHILKGTGNNGIRYQGETRTKTNVTSSAWTYRGRLFLPEEDEIWGRRIFGNTVGYSQMQQWALYRSGRRHFSKGAGNGASRSYVWCASSGTVAYFTYVHTNGIPSAYNAVNAFVGAPCFILS